MTWDELERLKKEQEEAKSTYKVAEEALRVSERKVAKASREYVASMGVDARYYPRHDPFDSEWHVYLNVERVARYTSFHQVVDAVREAEEAGHLTNKSVG